MEGDEDLVPLGCLGPQSLLALGKIFLFAVFFYAVATALGLWGA